MQAEAKRQGENGQQAEEHVKSSGHRCGLFILIAIVGVVCIAGAIVGIYFAVKPSDDDPEPVVGTYNGTTARLGGDADISGTTETTVTSSATTTTTTITTSTPTPTPTTVSTTTTAPDYDAETMVDELEELYGFGYSGCNRSGINMFSVRGRCYYMFTDHPTENYIKHACYYGMGLVLKIEDYNSVGVGETMLRDFEVCCLRYFRDHDPVWWQDASDEDEELQELVDRPFQLNYANDMIALYGFENFTYYEVTCDIGWKPFDDFWKTVTCRYGETYSHVCMEVGSSVKEEVSVDQFYYRHPSG